MSPDYTDEISKVARFMGSLLRGGMQPAHVSYEAYKYALALLEVYRALETSEAMETAAGLLEATTRQAGIQPEQLEAYTRQASRE